MSWFSKFVEEFGAEEILQDDPKRTKGELMPQPGSPTCSR